MTKPPALTAEQVRAGYPELTRCVQCGVLDIGTMRLILERHDLTVLTVWLHPKCRPLWKPPEPLLYRHPKLD